jgi:aryl-alcohol dehydrogenase-like predicted oxidoreductase
MDLAMPTKPSSSSRREFLESSATKLSVTALANQVLKAQTTPASAHGIPRRPLGRTGQMVSIICLGGWHIGAVKDDAEAIRIMHAAIDEGINFFDNAWDYHDGRAEEIMGKALAMDKRRDKVFLMTKNCERDYAGSMRDLEDSLRRLKTDHVDLWQFHELVYDNDPDWIFEKGGMKAALEAKKAGKVRFIGFTGHKDPVIHLKMLGKPYDWDTAQMPINVLDASYRSFQKQVIPVCLKKGTGVIGMKGLAGGYPQGALIAEAGCTAAECYRYALSQPVSAQVVGINSMQHLQEDVALARNFKPMTAAEKNALIEKVKEFAGDGRLERFKSTKDFDGPHHRRQHGFAV